MISTKSQIVTALSTVLPTYYELFVDNTIAVPCITYQEISNSDSLNSAEFGISRIGYMIKIWANKIADIETYKTQVDTKMRSLKFIRTSANELTYDNNIQLILTYEALGLERF